MMRKIISLLIAIAMILQSCSSYKFDRSNFDTAISKNVKVKATKSNGKIYIIKKIEKIDGVYYGEVDSGKGFEKLIISEDDFEKIQLYDKGTSIFLNVLLVAPIIFIGVAAIGLSNSGIM